MNHLGFNVYWWSSSRPLGVLRVLRDLARGGQGGRGCRIFYDYFDARGPHLFALLSSPEPLDEAAIAGRLRAAVEAEQGTADLPADRVAARHEACWGKQLCELDRGEGLVPHGTVASCRQPDQGYPLYLGKGLADGEAFWDRFSELSLWGIDLLLDGDAKQTGTALEWLTGVDEWLVARDPAEDLAEGYWRWHLGTLMPGLRDQLEAGSVEEPLLAGLEASVGERNRAVFEQVRDYPERRRFAPLLPELCALATRNGTSRDFAALRELNHGFLKQLGVPPSQQLPFVLSAWLRRSGKGLVAR